MTITRLLIVCAFLCACCNSMIAQTKVKIEHADLLDYDADKYGDNVRVLIGNVKFSHEGALMFCDTAYQYEAERRIFASGNVHIIQNDTIDLWGNTLEYNSLTSLAKVRGNVKLKNKETVLTTDYLDYDRANDVAYYFVYGEIDNGENTLTSKLGYYYPNLDDAFFKDSVVAHNPKYIIYSDTLKYNTVSKIANIEGPTTIESDSNIVYAEDGYYNTLTDVAELRENAYVEGKQKLSGDTIYYDRNSGFGETFGNMVLTDTANNMIIKGEYGYFNEITEYALATKDAVLEQVYQDDTLFMHADTLLAVPQPDTIDAKLIKAYYHVKFFRSDMQGRCDSMVFDSRDSTNTFYTDPIMWSLGNQLTADVIVMYSENQKLDKIELINRSFIIAEEDTGKYNQIKGKMMTGYVRNNELYKIDVDGSAETIYYPKDGETIMGLNKAQCSNMTIFLNQRQVDKIIMRSEPTGKLKPSFLVVDEDKRLDGFYWLDEFRPKTKNDIFFWEELPKYDRGEDLSEYLLDDTYGEFTEY